MKVLPFQIPKPTNDSLIYQEDHEYVFYDQLHQHEEIQLSFISKGSGTLIVGDRISRYQEGDVLVIDGNLPHVFKSDPNSDEKSLMLSLFFTRDGFGEGFFELAEMNEVKSFFRRIENGFRCLSNLTALEQSFESLKNQSKLTQFTTFLQILKLISKSKKESLSSYVYKKQYSINEGKRMRDVMSYTMQHSHETIKLETIAEVAAMTKNAFCKYFKKRTNKTYIQFLTELRVENACKLLGQNSDSSISEIAFESGFVNLSNFNRQFKALKGVSPSKFRTQN